MFPLIQQMSSDGFLDQDLRRPLPAQPSRLSRGEKLARGAPTWAITTTERLAGSSGLRDLDGHNSVHSQMFSPDPPADAASPNTQPQEVTETHGWLQSDSESK